MTAERLSGRMDQPNTPAFLEDYLDCADFGEALRELTGSLGDELGLPRRVDEVGLVCPNIRVAAAELKRRWPEMETFLLGEGSPGTFTENGKVTPFTTRVGFGFYKGVILELAEPGVGSEIFGQTPNPDGKIVINHVGFVARGPSLRRTDGGTDRDYAEVMRAHGIDKRVDAVLELLGIRGHIYIFETIGKTRGIEVEFLDFRLLAEHGPKISFPSKLSGMVGWFQETFGPRYLQLPAQGTLPPPVAPASDESVEEREDRESARNRDGFFMAALVAFAILFWGVHGSSEVLSAVLPGFVGPGGDPASRPRLIPAIPWDQELVSFGFGVVLAILIPVLVLVHLRKIPLRELGLALPAPGRFKASLIDVLVVFAVFVGPFAYAAATNPDMQHLYPLYRGPLHGGAFVAYELCYLLFFVALDGLLRGVLLFGLVSWGLSATIAVAAESIVQATWHLGKPLYEALGSPVWGVVGGIVAYRARSVWPAVLVHWLLNAVIDAVASSSL
jgi:hypothetical protein